ncbi:TLC domain-containing protein 4-like [Salvia hispanica]|uniref:TLC domain-containing protein 4-like n=1 Tax=Salvia hispanica TaxID=49212 RepID=UPI0020094503|nr:TLC domain-containing protein 4-like [Salvia hispanica]XP_047960700.1 TLC domain-containing protein 4-like [Salvia hispanica]
MGRSLRTAGTLKAYQYQAGVLVKNYVLADPYIPYTSIVLGILTCKLAYDMSQIISTFYSRNYNALTKIQRTEWNNRGISTLHAVFISIMSLYFVFWSELFSDKSHSGLVTFRNSSISTFALGLSVGYFLSDLAMICWRYPSLGGLEYVLHHSLAAIAVAYAMYMGEGQLYTFMILISEVTTPWINIRWYLDVSGLKRSSAYIINGVIIFFSWLVARILLFGYMFYHVYRHHSQVMRMHTAGSLLVFVVPVALAIMNVMWFGKILKGLKKALLKKT